MQSSIDPQERTRREWGCGHARHGFILIAVLWITALLSLFALHYSSSARVHGLKALHTEKWLTRAGLLQSGIDWGYHQYRKFKANQSLLQDEEYLQSISGASLNLKGPRQEPYQVSFGNQTLAVQILDIGGKVNVNSVDDELLGDILSACGLKEGVGRTTVINSLHDWMDSDDLHRQEGAEEDYYTSLENPYLPKNGPLESIGELLLIRGIDRELYAGSREHPGLQDFLTAYGQQTQMDINSARAETFFIIDGVPLQVIEDLIAYRKTQRIDDLTDIAEIIPQRYFGEMQRYYTVGSTGGVTITAYIVKEDGRLGQSMSRIFLQKGS